MHVRRHSRAPLHFAGGEGAVEETRVEGDEERVHVGTRVDQLVRRIYQTAHRIKSAARRLVDLRPASPKLSTASVKSSISAVRRLGRRHRRSRECMQYTSLVEDDHLADAYFD